MMRSMRRKFAAAIARGRLKVQIRHAVTTFDAVPRADSMHAPASYKFIAGRRNG